MIYRNKAKVIISDGENHTESNFCKKCGKEIPEGQTYCEACSASLDTDKDVKPRFPRVNGNYMKNLPPDDEDYDDDYDDDDDDDTDDSDMTVTYNTRSLPVAGIVAGAVGIAVVFLIIGIFIGKNSSGAFFDLFDLREETVYIDVIED